MLKAGLYIIATPIGNLSDITLRALETLKACDVIVCEDTRVSVKLLSAYHIHKPLLSYHDYNAEQVRPQLLSKIAQGQVVALISDAGTPLISDPGYKLVRACYEKGLYVTCLPGPSAVVAGLVLSGMPTDRFVFAGFADKKKYLEFAHLDMTLIFFESTQRLKATLATMAEVFSNREVAVVREITKLFEEVYQGTFAELIQHYERIGTLKGEVVLVLSPPSSVEVRTIDIDTALRQVLKTHSIRDACTLVAGSFHMPRKQVYQRALELSKEK